MHFIHCLIGISLKWEEPCPQRGAGPRLWVQRSEDSAPCTHSSVTGPRSCRLCTRAPISPPPCQPLSYPVLLVHFGSSPPKGCEGEKRFSENQETLDDFRDREEGKNQALSGFILRPPCSVIHRDLRQLPCLSLFFTRTVGRGTRVLRVVGEATPWTQG